MTELDFRSTYGDRPPVTYEKFFVPAIGAPLATRLLRLADLQPGDRVLDVACGTGIVARLAADAVGPTGTVTGVDINPGMLAVARSAAADRATIRWQQADAASMPFPDASFDVLLCQMGLQFMPDPGAALAEMRRVLAASGRLLLHVPGPTPAIFQVLAEALGRHIGPPAAGFVARVFSLHDADRVRGLLADAGFRDLSVQARTTTLRLPQPRAFLWPYLYGTPLAAAVSQADDDSRAALEREVVDRWQDFADDDGLRLDLRSVVAVAHA